MDPNNRIGRRLNLRDLNIFLVVAENHSMSKAAAQLAISQPVVSKAVADLEHTLGVTLLDRKPRGVEPTLYGRALIQRGIAVFDELRQSVEDIKFLADPTAGEVRVGATTPLAAGIVPAAADALVRRHPRVFIEVVEGDFAILLRSLRSRDIDLLIGRAPGPMTEEDIASDVLFDDRLLVVAGSRSKWARRQKIKLSELLDEPWVLPAPGTVGATIVAEVFHAMGLKHPRAAIAASSMAVHIHLLVAGHFLALLPASTVFLSARQQPLKALPVVLLDQRRPIVVATLKKRTPNPVASLFIESARAVARSSMKGR